MMENEDNLIIMKFIASTLTWLQTTSLRYNKLITSWLPMPSMIIRRNGFNNNFIKSKFELGHTQVHSSNYEFTTR